MTTATRTPVRLSPRQAWEPLPPLQWNASAARHLLRRAGWNASPDQVRTALRDGNEATVRKLFLQPSPFPLTEAIKQVDEDRLTYRQRVSDAVDVDDRRRVQREFRQQNTAAFQDYAVKWLDFASRPENAAHEKWVTFLQNIFVVSFDRVRNPSQIFQHHDLLREKGNAPYPELCKAVSRSPAMMQYLDINRSQASAPNENFARELFELFILGEGNYTENDIKEAARAFTGYRYRANGDFYMVNRQHDGGRKTVFGHTGNLTGDGVIDLAFQQPAASVFLPTEMCRFYLSDEIPPPEHLDDLGRAWRRANYSLEFLKLRFFTSRLFYERRYRGNLIKSPMQFHLGLMRDLNLNVPPYPRPILTPYRQMGQNLFNPPNVRGWVGGQVWINSTTLSARRSLVTTLFQEINEDRLNADDQAALRAAREHGPVTLYVTRERLRQMADSDPGVIANRFINYFLATPVTAEYRSVLTEFIQSGPGNRDERLRTAVMALLQSAEYHLC